MFFDNLFSDFNPFGSYTYRQPRREVEDPFSYPSDNKSIILRKIFDDEYNYMCFDCHRETNSLDYFDIKNGIFLCYTCAQRHAQLPKEVSQVMTGNIRNMEEKDLLLLYYGGNKNLIEFIRRHFPLLENMQIKEMYCSKAMDYYRKLIRSKAFDEDEPDMPGKKKGYKSMFYNKINNPSPSKENQRLRQGRNNEERERQENNDENNEDNFNDNIFSSTFFGDDLFGRNRRNQNKRHEENNYKKTEPAVIKNNKKEENDEPVNAEKTTFKKINKTKINESPKKKEEKKEETKKEAQKEINTQIKNTVTINQIGEINRYPDAMEIDGMECE